MSVQQVVEGFARSAAKYDAYAQVQFQCAGRLAAFMEANTRDLLDGPIVEVGCGTGIMSARVVEAFPDRALEITDICEEMLTRCRLRLSSPSLSTHDNIVFAVKDAQDLGSDRQYALVIAAFTLQWMENLQASLASLTKVLKPGGKLFFSVPTAGSFPEWKSICVQAGVTYTANTLPSATTFREFGTANNYRLSLYEETFPVHHQSFEQFLLSLKSIGAGTSITQSHLSFREMRKLLQAAHQLHPKSFTATYKVLFGYLSVP